MLDSLDALVLLAKNNTGKTIAVAAAEDLHTLEALKRIQQQYLVRMILVGDREKIYQYCETLAFDIRDTEVIHSPHSTEACSIAVSLVKQGRADVLMKGMVNSGIYLRAILDKVNGLRASGLIAQMALIEAPFYHKIFAITDAGLNISPSLKDKTEIIRQIVGMFRRLNIQKPRIALISAQENISESIPASVDAAVLSMMGFRQMLGECIVEGPLSIDLAFSADSCRHKGIETRVGGETDCALFPDINSANTFYKTITQLYSGKSASFLTGTTAPVVFTSRSDTVETKYYSVACALAECGH